MDYRVKENRLAGFEKWYKWSIKYNDCDPSIYLLNYLFDRFEHNIEQKLWICFLYGTTYYLPTAWIIWNEFPDYELVDYDRLKKWNDDNYSRLRYQTDTKYNKGYLPQQFLSYKKWIESYNPSNLQYDKFNSYPKDTFEIIWNEIKNNLYKFGRYTTWFYMQSLHSCAKIPLEPNNLKLNDYSGSRSHRNGLLYAIGQDSLIDKKLSNKQYNILEYKSKNILNNINSFKKTNFYEMETALCSFKKVFRRSRGRYLGYYLDRQAEEIKKVEQDDWNGIDWNVFWQGREECLKENLQYNEVDKNKYNYFLDNGDFNTQELLL
tara:strand:- start:971 stop:1930 length:960 start_codon:yes stop_codon:yes gene_type:complete